MSRWVGPCRRGRRCRWGDRWWCWGRGWGRIGVIWKEEGFFVLGWFVWVMAFFGGEILGGEILGGERDVQVAVLCVGSIAGLHTNSVGVSV